MRKRLQVGGVVQGLGFRPWVYRLAVQHGLCGYVQNQSDGVLIDVQGTPAQLDSFTLTLRQHPLFGVSVERWSETNIAVDPALTTFSIVTSQITDAFMPVLVPDLATCQECLGEVRAPGNRRYGYVFNSCAGCGPRYSITKALPYDRENTAMQAFTLCDDCQREYHDPTDRRFHAQLMSCPVCGPRLFAIDRAAGVAVGVNARPEITMAGQQTASLIARAAQLLAQGEAIAIKGIGGYQILVGSGSLQKLADLRAFKQRSAKPFALMVPDLHAASSLAQINEFAAQSLETLFNPIVVLAQRREGVPSYLDAVAPTLTSVGLMLPSTPLHHWLAQLHGAPIVVTSANRADEPMVYRDGEIESAVGDFCALIIGHDRPIVAPVDDSVITEVDGKTVVLRAGRGWAPMACANPWASHPLPPVLAFGAQQRNAVAIGNGHFFLSGPYTGDLSPGPGIERSVATRQHLLSLMQVEPERVLCDDHPAYESTALARESGKPLTTVQHHVAHALAVAAEQGIKDDFLAVTWDGFGYGCDGSLWGGEWLRVQGGGIHRVASLLPFPVLGLDAMAKDPRLSALALLSQLYPERAEEMAHRLGLSLPPTALRLQLKRVARSTQLLWTSSAGRLIDGVAAMLGLINAPSYDGHAAMLLNEHASLAESPLPVAVAIDRSKPCALIDWRGPLQQLIDARLVGIDTASLSTFFWRFLAETVAHIAEHEGATAVVLGGGCFQGPTLLQAVVSRLEASGITPRWSSRLPAGDGAIAFGQLAALAYANSTGR